MWGKSRATAALLALLALSAPLSVAIAKSANAHPRPGALFIGAPTGFGTDEMHWRISKNGKAMRLEGWFAWNYGCARRNNPNYGIGDAATLAHLFGGSITAFPAPAIAIHGSSFSGSQEFQRHGHKYGQFTIRGRFTSARAAKASFSFANPPRCGTFTEHFSLRAV